MYCATGIERAIFGVQSHQRAKGRITTNGKDDDAYICKAGSKEGKATGVTLEAISNKYTMAMEI